MEYLTFEEEIKEIEKMKEELLQTGQIQTKSQLEQSMLLEALNYFEVHCRQLL